LLDVHSQEEESKEESKGAPSAGGIDGNAILVHLQLTLRNKLQVLEIHFFNFFLISLGVVQSLESLQTAFSEQ
jgi:hypothetical protein